MINVYKNTTSLYTDFETTTLREQKAVNGGKSLITLYGILYSYKI